MIFSFSDAIPAATSYANRRRTVMKLMRGVVHKVEIQFPIGTAALAHCTINDALHQIWPTNTGESFATDGFVVSFDESYELLNNPFTLDLWTWNESTTHEHVVTVRLGMLKKRDLISYIIKGAIEVMVNRLGV